MPLPRALARFNRRVTNPVAGLVAGRMPGLGVLVHRGRKSGRVYHTPVTVFNRDGAYRIALTYGRDVDWLKNILAAGEFELELDGRTIALTDPIVRHDAEVGWAPIGVRQMLHTLSADCFVEAHPAS
ncbi:nitroreductase family deazaflavin-dependent oxidoreductase [Nocardia macrotermitis]|uniref:Nitroreductase family deazaflavin-dependent oxidoreductase n=1 Tax=Nocardia macrotermitis TaxID=2585198 RepID=A0A7K0CUV7_9NOCA|nr:nitroreductase family deazaflavin-dependent oxidoreductase [Nocardia macrotermitis]MQY17267.1 hypothetical protein [Nocardia macrotermitis]